MRNNKNNFFFVLFQNTTWEEDDAGWWSDAQEVPSTAAALHSLLLGVEGGLGFVPPPPRPSIFALEELGSEAFTATCDLCDWAWRDQALLAANNREFHLFLCQDLM